MKNIFDSDRLEEIWVTIKSNKMRSVLTAFGVFWGIFMLVIMSGAGYALQNGVTNEVKDFATNTGYFIPNQTTEAYKGFRKGRHWSMKNDDMIMLQNSVDGIKYMSGMLFMGSRTNNTVRGDKYGTYSVKGVHPVNNLIEPQSMLYGRFVNDIDIKEKRKVAVIGKKVYEDIFLKNENPLGQFIKVDGIYYQVIGVAEPKTNINIGGKPEETIIMPFSTVQQAYNQGTNTHCIVITAYDDVRMSDLEKVITDKLKIRNNIAPSDPNAIMVINIEKQFTMFKYLFLGIKLLIWIVGLGTLISGVVGVSNIMLVTVKERTREIGIRRALGAKPSTILVQIMLESLFLTLLAGFTGIASGVGILNIVDKIMAASAANASNHNTFFASPQIPFDTAVAAAIVLIISGVCAGLLPAMRALQIKAIDAIRDE